jgi:hypothetical protein
MRVPRSTRLFGMLHCRANASAVRLLTFRIGYTCGDWRWCEWGTAIVLLGHGVEGMAKCDNDTPETSIVNLDITVAPLRSHTQVWRHPLDGV